MRLSRYITLATAVIISATAWAQFNPSNPPEPTKPKVTHEVRCQALPSNGGSVTSAKKVEEGARSSVSASPNSGYTFVQWEDSEGNVLSSSSYYSFVMGTEDLKLIARFRYTPDNPSEPSTPVKYYKVSASVNPPSAGYVNGTGSFAAGVSAHLYAYNYTDYIFKNWTDAEGNVLSTSYSFPYIVKADNNANKLKANYVYSPGNPGEPAAVQRTYPLTLRCTPSAGGYISRSSGERYTAGSRVDLQAYAYNNYIFLNWTDEEGNVVSTGQYFQYTMPDKAATLTANFKFMPQSPSDPGASQPRRNVIYGSRQTVTQGSGGFYSVMLENTDAINGMVVDITVPDGYTFDFDNIVTSPRASAATVSAQKVTEGTYRVTVTSTEAFEGGNGAIFRLPVTVPLSAESGSSVTVGMTKGVVYKTDGSQTPTEATDGILKIAESEITLPDSPDFLISSVNVGNATLDPGDTVSVSWQVANEGNIDALGGWSETVALVDANGSLSPLGTLYYDTERLAVGESVSRSGSFTIPRLPSVDGALNIRVTITPYASSGEIDAYGVNNSLTTENTPLTLTKALTLTLPESVNEGETTSVRCMLERSGSRLQAAVFNLSRAAGDSRVRMPETVTIPKGQSGTYFIITVDNNDILDETENFTIRAAGEGYEPVEASMKVIDDEMPEIELSLPSNNIAEGEMTRLTVTLPKASDHDVTVRFTTDVPGRLQMPASVIIPAGETTVVVDVTAVDNDRIENEADVSILASADKYENGETFLIVEDNDMPTLRLELSPAEVSEGGGPAAVRGLLTRETNLDKAVTVLLTDDSNGALIHDARIVLEAGVTSREFNIGVVDNQRVDGDRDVEITAAVFLQSCSCSAAGTGKGSVTKTIKIIDNDGPSLSLRSRSATLRRDMPQTTLTVSRNTDTDSAVTVTLSADPDGLLEMPAAVTMAKGEASATVSVSAPLSSFTGVEKTVTISATAPDFSKGTTLMLISDQTLPDATVSLAAPEGTEYLPGTPVTFTVTIGNEGNTVMPGAVAVDLLLGHDPEPAATAFTTKNLQPGESETLTVSLPAPKVPGDYTVTAHANETATFRELTRANNISEARGFKVTAPFTAVVEVTPKSVSPDGKVTATGRVNGICEELEFYYITDGSRRTVNVRPGEDGTFSLDFTPEYPGDYTVGVCVPGEGLTEAFDSFSARGFQLSADGYISFDLPAGDSSTYLLRLRNDSSEPITGLKVTANGKPDGCGLQIEAPSTVGGNATAEIRLTAAGNRITEGNDWERFTISTSADGCTTRENTVYFFCRPNKAKLTASVSQINTTMTMGSQRVYRLVVGNQGKAETGEITLSLPPFMTNGTALTLPSVKQGELIPVDIILTPTSDMQLNVPVTGKIGINCKYGDGIAIPYSVEPVSSETGKLIVDVKDEYTFNTAGAPHVADATVIISHPVSGKLIATGKTDADGLWETELPAGFYNFDVSADKHTGQSGTLQIAPGTDNRMPVFISFNAISYSWQVEETTVDDTYEIVNTVTYETRVPKPVVVVDFPKLSYSNQIAYISVTNKGLISAYNVDIEMPEPNEHVTMEVIGDSSFPELRAGENIRVPVRVTVDEEGLYPDFRLAVSSYSFTGDTDSGSAARNVQRRAVSGACVRIDCKVLVDDYECDPFTGEPIYKGKKPIDGSYYTGNCHGNPPSFSGWGGIGGISGTPSSPGSSGGPGLPSATGKTESAFTTYAADRLHTILTTGCVSDCEKALADAIKACWDAVSGCRGGSGDFDPQECLDALMDNCNPNKYEDIHDAISCPTGGGGTCIPKIGCPASVAECINRAYKAFKECMALYKHNKGNHGKPQKRTEGGSDDYDSDEVIAAKERRAEAILLYQRYVEALRVSYLNILGDGVWNNVSNAEIRTMLKYLTANYDADGHLPAVETLMEGKPEGLDYATYASLIERFNNSFRYEETGESSENMIDPVKLEEVKTEIRSIMDEVRANGYADFNMFLADASEAVGTYQEMAKTPSEGVCSSITLQFRQTMVMTRQAFRGTLSVTNGNDKVAMTEVRLQLKIRDAEGNLVGDREFAVSTESLEGFDGQQDLTSGWALAPKGTGVATVLFIPSKFAAPVEPLVYSFGGTLSYVDPFTGADVSVELTPIEMTVSPSPLLDLNYFMQRDVIGDDALTEKVESSEPAEFALIISNKGYGTASNLRMQTEQPEIIDNSKGLQVDFTITGSSLMGRPSTMGIGRMIPTEFGDLPANSSTFAQWWFKCPLLGHFNDYDVKATQVSAYASEDMSLLDKVAVHELIHGMTPEGCDETRRLFLANDIDDADNAPDMVYYSDGSAERSMSAARSVTVTDITDTSCIVSLAADNTGWVYAGIDAPWENRREIVGVTRLSDGAELPADNFWITHVTLHDSSSPVYVERLHCAADLGTGSERYRLAMESRPETELAVASFEGVPQEHSVSLRPVEEISFTFNKPVDESTLSTDNLTLVCQGSAVDRSHLSIARHAGWEEDTPKYSVKFGEGARLSGYMVLTVDPVGIHDLDGHNGTTAARCSWNQLADGNVIVSATASPADGGSVTPSTLSTPYGKEITLTATPAEGYEFSAWRLGSEVVGEGRELRVTPVEDMALTARFTLSSYNVEIECDTAQGEITGAASGIYSYGTSLTATAQPAAGYTFLQWVNADGELLSKSQSYTFTVDGDMSVTAIFEGLPSSVSAVADNGVTMVHPNPVHTYLKIDGDFETIESIEVIDTAGSFNFSAKGYRPGMPVNLSQLSPGVYIVSITTEKGTSSHRIVKL